MLVALRLAPADQTPALERTNTRGSKLADSGVKTQAVEPLPNCAAAMAGEVDAIVTAPVQKSTINDAGIAFTGHTEYLAFTL